MASITAAEHFMQGLAGVGDAQIRLSVVNGIES